MSIIELRQLTKSYKRFEKEAGLMGSVKSLFNRKYTEKTAISSFDLKVEEGEFVGLIGQNGAGKTTLVKMLTGIISPSSGDISVMGYYPNKLENSFKRQYAIVMGQKSQLFFELTPADTFLLFKELYDISDEEYKRNLDYFIELFDVSEYLNVQVRTLSLGERMKMELIVALLHNPKILFLDEPTIGLDAVAQKQIRYFLKEVNETKGTTIILTSHYMEDIKSLCSRSIVVENSHKIYDGSTEELFNHFQKYKKITVSFADEADIKFPKDCKIIEQTKHKISVVMPKERGNETVKWIFDNYDVKDVIIEEEDIGNIVERIYKKGSEEYRE
ncbi:MULTISPECIES: ATP-binding cassette domain-containing protein [Clostridioides]|uniref:ABC transporter ATP-binding protein n=1 Tax=Clostridioides sp. ZZV14-6387 TaxID=2811497 RepID=UPI0007BC5A94|nr:ATP-binding cassette domain-containing protein [Clostridioides sp. ZZV14-6387]MDI0267156.1 ATP-binding cassette domain-containing protein [Clostridioides difficile]MDI7817157.1 ATP-binding cassette domain-containing protein [Clostridioides difficile]NJJ35120.1 ATP-binding cassette domain-containing protein [Clostridioides difficile]NJK15591.1 ATP-binding cassette domain-containing protein [Clostridioides difficile]